MTVFSSLIVYRSILEYSFSMMVRCWALNPADRPTFKQLNATMDELLQTATGYSEFKMTLLRPETVSDSTDPG